MNDPGLNNLLKWGIQHSDASRTDPNASAHPPPEIDVGALQRLMQGAPSNADLMVESMNVIDNQQAALPAKYIAFKNFELLIQNLDNANNMANRGLWGRLIKHLDSEHADLRMWAAWCCGTAVQNNVQTQERLLISDAIPTLVRMATSDPEKLVRKKAILALSSAIRNFQPGLDAAIPHLPVEYRPRDKLNASDMDSIDTIISKLRDNM